MTKNEITEKRIKLTRSLMDKQGVDALFVVTAENRRYISGFTAEDNQFDELAGAILLTSDKAILMTDSRYKIEAKQESGFFCEIHFCEKNFFDELSDIVKELKTSVFGFEAARLSYLMYKRICKNFEKKSLGIKIVPLENTIESLRMIKDNEEIKTLKKALNIAESAFSEFIESFRTYLTEKEAAEELKRAILINGADSLSFPIIVASGTNSASPHAVPKNRITRKKEPILFDWGAKLDGYCSDISRTVFYGKSDGMFEKIFKIVSDASKKAIEHIAPGILTSEIDKIARDYIDNTEFRGKFGHALGHGTGLCVHETPSISKLDKTILKPNMVFTVEPGIYIKEWGGIRLENMVAVTESGVEVLNNMPFECL